MARLNNRSPKSGKIKIALFISAVFIVIPILSYTHHLVSGLQKKEQEVASLYAKSVEYIANSTSVDADYSFIFNEIILAIDFPIIETDTSSYEIKAYRNIEIDSTQPEEKQLEYIRSLIPFMDRTNKPIIVSYQDTLILSIVHYGESPLVTQLRWLPYIEIAIGSIFILIGYIGFSYIKRNEQSNIWVGMARETAHQLGTPLSSMMGWAEILRLHGASEPKIIETVDDMDQDLMRLRKIAERFSKIGSKPDLKEEPIAEIINNVIGYFQKRLPHMGKTVEIHVDAPLDIKVNVNRELFEWVLENLIKNALDAMDEGNGKITFTVSQDGGTATIDISDTGKGIDPKYRKDVFRPGFSTKKRGWGLGLSLSKRIIESYHHGKLTVKESKVGVGTTFRIRLR